MKSKGQIIPYKNPMIKNADYFGIWGASVIGE
jgi:hypothetical protein